MNNKIGLIGLGKMGYNLALNMRDNNISVVGYNRSKGKIEQLEAEGVAVAYSVESLMDQIGDHKIIWLMVPAGDPVDQVLKQLLEYLSPGDIVIDGGNSKYTDTLRRHEILKEQEVFYVDAGTSGGTDGARFGACMMVGGDQEAIDMLDSIFKALCVKDGYQHVGESGTGHYVKMVHNGIEYGMMQAIAEGFDILDKSEFSIDFEKVARVWNNGAIISGYLMEMTQNAFINNDQALSEIKSVIDSSGEGLWTAEEALRLRVSAPVITHALFNRYKSKDKESFADKLIAAQRNEFGGHKLHKK